MQLQPVHSHPAPPLMGPAPGQGSASTGPQPQALGGPALGIMHQHRTYHIGFGRMPSAVNTRHTCTLVKLFIISCLHLLTIFHCALLSTRTVYWCASFVPTVQLQPARHRAPLPPPPRPAPAPQQTLANFFPIPSFLQIKKFATYLIIQTSGN